eukprot:m.6526 g.6526  ORF g.6526 m.6526 type:complete len:252 (-) comp2665_c0_seq1:87-842(-)
MASDSERSSDEDTELPAGFSFFSSGADLVSDDDDSDVEKDSGEKTEGDEGDGAAAPAEDGAGHSKRRRTEPEPAQPKVKLPSVKALLAKKKAAPPAFLTTEPAMQEPKSFDKRKPPETAEEIWKRKNGAQASRGSGGAHVRQSQVQIGRGTEAVAAATAMASTYSTSGAGGSSEPAPGIPADPIAAAQQQAWRSQTKKGNKSQKAGDGQLTFNEREKRKRDQGMSSRGKSFVEEEKRLLRANAVAAGQGFD